jgi:hypothetical protein
MLFAEEHQTACNERRGAGIGWARRGIRHCRRGRKRSVEMTEGSDGAGALVKSVKRRG